MTLSTAGGGSDSGFHFNSPREALMSGLTTGVQQDWAVAECAIRLSPRHLPVPPQDTAPQADAQ